MAIVRRLDGTTTVVQRRGLPVPIPTWMEKMTLADLVRVPEDGRFRHAIGMVRRLRHGKAVRSTMRTIRSDTADQRCAEATKERDGWACRKCGRTREQGYQMQAAHIVPRGKRYSRTHRLVENRLTMCVTCHGWAHENLKEFVRWATEQIGVESIKKLMALSPSWKGWRHLGKEGGTR